MRKIVRDLSPAAILGWTFILFLGPFLMAELFPAQLDRVIDKSSYLVFHNFAEFFSIMVSLSVFGVGWFTYDQSRDRHVLFLGTAFLGVALLDFMHTMSNVAMPAFISPNSTNKSTQFWVAARLFDSAAFLLSAFVYPEGTGRWLSKKALMTAALTVVGGIFAGVTFFPSLLPATAIAGVGLTPFKRYCELMIIGLLVAAGVAYWRRMVASGERLLIHYLAAFIICIFSEAVFASYKTGFDTFNVLGHIYKVVAFSLIYTGIFAAAVKRPYLGLTAANETLLSEIAERRRVEDELARYRDHLEELVRERTDQLEAAKEDLKHSLREKEVLLKEIHHRVKNNLQVISSLVDLQADTLGNPDLSGLFQDMRDRVRSMALVHEKLYQSENLARVEFGEYLRSLLHSLWRAHSSSANPIQLTLELQPLSLSVETAVPCGLIVNELAVNALKHAFRDRADGEVVVALGIDPDGRVSIRVRDNGVGLPGDLDWRHSRSLGLRLVEMLTRQLNGAMEVVNGAGTEFRITFGCR